MKRYWFLSLLLIAQTAFAAIPPPEGDSEYAVGVGDELEISVLQPDQFIMNVSVAPDGYISFPYIGKLKVKGSNTSQIQKEIEKKLGEGYLKYPVVTVYLKQSKSKKYLVSGEIERPGAYFLEDDLTVLRAISIAGGFTPVANTNSVKILRLKKDHRGYETIYVNMKRAMDGDMASDVELKPEDMIIVPKSFF